MLNSINALLVATFIIILIRPGFTTEKYCSKKICPKGNHIRCRNNGSFGQKCPKKVNEVTMTEELRSLIVDTHNKVRQRISAGKVKGLGNSNRMIELAWNEELAENALYTAKTCVYAHDECRNTEKFNNVGQNIAMFSTKAVKPIDYKNCIKGILDNWLAQAENCNMKLIEQFRSNSGDKVDDFAQMIRAHCSQIGCAIVFFERNGTKNVFLVCNYSSANVPKEPVYEVGPACSACKAGCSFTSPGLCNTKEESYKIAAVNLLDLIKIKIG